MAVHTSLVTPLPHQITAVYEQMLHRQPLRYLLADEPGAGKTIIGIKWRYSFMERDANSVLVLKPHGSINWFHNFDGKRNPINVLDFRKELPADLASNPPLLIPPVPYKFLNNSTTEEVCKNDWRAAYDSIVEAKSLDIIGYSLPYYDHFPRFVLRRAIVDSNKYRHEFPKITVVNPDPQAEFAYTRLLGKERYTFYETTFENYAHWC